VNTTARTRFGLGGHQVFVVNPGATLELDDVT
jgi:hypothetical protein